jgi:hemerythrin superfamily protein
MRPSRSRADHYIGRRRIAMRPPRRRGTSLAAATPSAPHRRPLLKGSTMTARKTTSSSDKSSSRKREAGTDAVALLKQDHQEVQALFDQYDELIEADDTPDEQKQQLAEQICAMLTVHAQIEEEIFYPAARRSLDEPDLIDEATVEHATAKDLIAQIQDGSPDEELYDAKVKVLGEYIRHHVKEEEGEMFPKLKKSDIDLAGLGTQMAERKQELMAEVGLAEASDAA